MSTPPNPYGQQPNPYGQPQYPQQQPPHPQPGYGQQQPYPGAGGGWGGPLPYAPPVPPPKRKNRTGLTISLAFGLVALLLGLAWFGNRGSSSSSGGGESSFPAAEYGLTAPKTLLDGTYELADDQSAERQKQLESSTVDESNIRDPKATVAQYTSTSEGGVLVLSGLYGLIKDPDTARESILRGAAGADGSTLAVPAKDFTPAGSEVTITCQVVTMDQAGGGTGHLPICAWADDNTNVSVTLVTDETAKQSPEDIDLESAAATTAQVREEIRQPLN
ncbi:hypothetical protein ACIQ7Q_16465 [Streptomyces sp. NPDC096176]|uniref:hypothetical protein n=1 Tax=Streptomyces sp. NPDC096176 TaxID=3366079 RepID=UPI0038193EEC